MLLCREAGTSCMKYQRALAVQQGMAGQEFAGAAEGCKIGTSLRNLLGRGKEPTGESEIGGACKSEQAVVQRKIVRSGVFAFRLT